MNKGVKSLDRQTGLVFDKRQTNIAKGIAVLLLLWHHVFFSRQDYYELFQSVYIFHGVPIECIISDFCKVCVAIFVVLSGYGLYKSWNSKLLAYQKDTNCSLCIKDQFAFVKSHLIKLLFGYWFIYLIFVPMGIFFDKPFWEIYNNNILFGIIDFFGLANLFSTPTMNATWWFMGTIIVLYILFPVLMKLFSYSNELTIAFAALLMILPIPNIGELKTWLLPFVAGIYLADRRGFERLDYQLNTLPKRYGVLVPSIIVTAVFYHGNSKLAILFAVAIIAISFSIISRIPIFCRVLEIFGKYSSGIFMFHTFIYKYYFQNFIYSFKISLIIFIVLSGICLVIAFLLEKVKYLLRLDRLLINITQ